MTRLLAGRGAPSRGAPLLELRLILVSCNPAGPGTYEDNGKKLKFSKGTTTLAFVFQHGVIVSVDSRASQGQQVRG